MLVPREAPRELGSTKEMIESANSHAKILSRDVREGKLKLSLRTYSSVLEAEYNRNGGVLVEWLGGHNIIKSTIDLKPFLGRKDGVFQFVYP